jgi:hypothetical protein
LALFLNTTGFGNTAIGEAALYGNTTGTYNTAIGVDALSNNATGIFNIAIGYQALFFNTGNQNTANGDFALYGNTTGGFNTAIGINALSSNRTGSSNIAIGDSAGRDLTTGSNNIDIVNLGVAGESGAIRIGTAGTQIATYVAGIYQAAIGSGLAIRVSSSGKLGTMASSARYKEAIKPMDKESEAILALLPVSFRYKKELDPEGTPQFGLVAEDVAKVDPALVVADEQGQPFTVRYEAVNAMLLNEFLKEHRTVESLEKAMAEQQKENAAMRAMLKEQAAQIQKVSAQLEVNKTAPQIVLNNQ